MTTLQDDIEAARQTIRSDALSMSVGEIVNLYRDEEMIIRPEFQRLFRWDIEQKSRLIESLLLGIPIPSIFVMQTDDGVWEVIDGLQRISTILEFMGELRDEKTKEVVKPSVLFATDYLPKLQGVSFVGDTEGATSSFTPGQRLALKRAKIDLKILLPETDERAKFELFDRLNTGGSLLSAQEIRNTQMLMRDPSLFRWLNALRELDDFQATIPLSSRLLFEAYDMELVCRYFALLNSSDDELRPIGNIDNFISRKIFQSSDLDTFDRVSEADRFQRTFSLLNKAIGEDSFKRNESGRFLGAFSVSAFETVSVGIGAHIDGWEQAESESPGAVRRRVEEWWKNGDFRSGSGSGISASARLPRTLPAARKFFEK